MLTRRQWWLLMALAALLAATLGAGVAVERGNAALQADLAEGQQYLQQTAQLQRVHRDLHRALAALAERSGDAALRELLAEHEAPR